MQSFSEFFASVINHNPINGLHLFWDSFKWFCLQISWDAKYFFLYCSSNCDQGLIVVKVYYFQIWSKKEPIISSGRVISSHMGPSSIQIAIHRPLLKNYMKFLRYSIYECSKFIVSRHWSDIYIKSSKVFFPERFKFFLNSTGTKNDDPRRRPEYSWKRLGKKEHGTILTPS